MCGVVGIVELEDNRPPDRRVVLAMANALSHRGPDSAGDYVDDLAALAARRLALVAPSDGDQPIRARDQVLVANGEIYDHAFERKRLEARGAAFSGSSDVEVLLHLLADGDVDSLASVNGQFALAHWCRTARRLILARDPFGIAPLFYARCGSKIIFGSEIKALLQYPGLERRLDPAGLDQVAIFPGLVSPTTLFAEVRSLPPGHALIATPQGVRLHRYWDLVYPVESGDTADVSDPAANKAAQTTLGELLDAAVERRLQGEAEVGVLLSGGLDSSTIAASLRRQHPARPIRAYGAVFPNLRIDEGRYQRAAAASLGLDLTQLAFDAARIVDHLPKMIWHAECPVRESYNVCSFALAEAARRDGVRVLLGGEGADELFAGYPGHRVDQAVGRSTLIPSGSGGWKTGTLYERDYPVFSRSVRRLYSPDVRRQLAERDALDVTRIDWTALHGRHIQHQRSYLDVKLRLGDHLLGDHGDHMVCASGVEPRFPFLDRDLVAFAQALPPAFNLRDGVEKHLLRRVGSRDLPPPLSGRSKYGFRAFGTAQLLKDPRVLEWLSPRRVRDDGWFDPVAVADLIERAQSRACDFNPHAEDDLLMIVLTFNIFLDVFQTAAVSQGGV